MATSLDIVERLRNPYFTAAGQSEEEEREEAADEIERLRAELAECRVVRDSALDVSEQLRNDALEEAAQVAEDHGEEVSNEKIGKACSRNIANAIRALKEKAEENA